MKSLYLHSKHHDSFNPARAISSGCHSLDLALPQGGWKTKVINEFVSDQSQISPLSMLAPTLATLSEQGRWIVLIGAQKSHVKEFLTQYPIATNKVLLVHPKDQLDAQWAMEQALMSGTSSAVLGWLGTVEKRDIRRLQIAAKHSKALAFIFQQSQEHDNQVLNCHAANQPCQQLNLNNIQNLTH